MIKNEHVIWAAYFPPSIYVQQCVSLPSFVASQWQQVYSCACCASADRCAIHVLYYPPSAKCVRVCCQWVPTLLYAMLPLSSYNIDMQCLTHSFTNSSGSVPVFNADTPFFSGTLCRLSCFLIFVDLINLPFLLLLALIPMFSAICRPRCCCHQQHLLSGTLCCAVLF